MSVADHTFQAMGSRVRLIIGPPRGPGVPDPEATAERLEREIHDYAARLSRFRLDSELTALNDDPRDEVPASRLLVLAVAGARLAAQCSGGLVDPTLLGAIERAGYRESLEGARPASLREALAAAPPRRPAAAAPDRMWTLISVDREAGIVRRPAGLRIDNGGTGKGLAADLVAASLGDYEHWVVDCGGDIRIGGRREVEVSHPLNGRCVRALHLADCAVASSGMDVRIWRTADGAYAHHLLDPSTGEPAWTGLIAATAVAPTALQAETLSKVALLSGPEGARAALERHGGLIVHDDGRAEDIGRVRERPVVRLRKVAA